LNDDSFTSAPQLKRDPFDRKTLFTSMKESREETIARRFFETLGCSVERIAPAQDPQADFRIQHESDRYIVEVKGRGPDQDFARQLRESGQAGSQAPMSRTNTISRQVSEAAGQLATTDPTDDASIRLMAFVAAGDDPELQVDQFQKTLYGTVDLLKEASPRPLAVPCYYFTHSDFFRYRHIDGALVLAPSGARLCVNDKGNHCSQLRASGLFTRLNAHGAVTDPERAESSGEGFIADTGHDRADEDGVLAYVREKYSRPELITFKPIKVRSAVNINWESE